MAKFGDELRRRVYGSAKPTDDDVSRVRKLALTVDPVVTKPQEKPSSTGLQKPSRVTSSAESELSRLENLRRKAAMDLDTDTLNSITKRMKEIRRQSGKQTVGDRGSDILSSMMSGSAGAYTNAAGVVADNYQDPDYNRRQIERLQETLRTGRTTDGKPINEAQRKTIQESIQRMQGEIQKWEAPNSTANRLFRAADQMSEDSAGFRDSAKKGLGAVGSTLVDASISFGQSAMDGALGGVTGAGMLPFAVRSFGGSTQEARQNGASKDEQLIYGSAQAAKEFITEKLFGLAVPQRLAGEAGAGSFDDMVKTGIKNVTERLAKTEGGQRVLGGILTWLAGGATEGLEEGIGAVIENTLINPNLKDFAPDTRTRQQKFDDALQDMLVGGVSGLLGVTNLAQYQPSASTRSVVDAAAPKTYNKNTKSTQPASPAAAPHVQQMDEQAQITQVENPDSEVLDAATTMFVQQGMKLKTAKEKAGIIRRLVDGEEVSVRDINKLNPTSRESQQIFTELTGVQFPEGKLTTEQLYNLYRSAKEVTVQSVVQETAAPMAENALPMEVQGPAVDADADALRMAREEIAHEAEAQTEQETTTEKQTPQNSIPLSQQMANSGFQANPETQDRIAQAQAELNDAINGTSTAVSRKAGGTRNSIALNSGRALTRDQFKQAVQATYAARGVETTEPQLDAMFNNFLAIADHGGDVSMLEAIADALKEDHSNDGQAESQPAGQRDTGDRDQPVSEVGRDGRSVGEGQEESGAPAEDLQGAGRGGKENRPSRPVYAEDEVRPDSRGSGERRGSGEVRGEGQETSGDGVLREVRGESGGVSEGREPVKNAIRRLAKQRAEAFQKKNHPTQKMDVGTGVENDILPEKYWSKDIRRIAKQVRAAGGEFHVTVGAIRYRISDDLVGKADGLTIPDGKIVLVRADSPTKLPSQIGGHELLHLYMLDDSTLIDRLRYRVLGALDDTSIEDFDAALQNSYANYEDCYGDFEENYDLYLAEFLCDLNGDVRTRIHTSDENFDYMRSVVVKAVKQWESEQSALHTKNDSTNQQKAGRPSLALTTEMTWDEQLDTLDDYGDYNALYIEETPNILAEVGLADLPLSMTKAHMRDILHPKDPSNAHWHGVPEGVVRNLPELLSRPAMVLRSNTVKGDIVVVLQATDSDGNPIIASIQPNGTAYVDGKVGPANFITSVYGRANFASRSGEAAKNNFLYLALRNRSILYWNEKRTEALAHRSRLQLPQTLRKVPSDTILSPYDGYVKGDAPKRLFSLEDENTDDFGPDSDTEVPKFGSWNEAYFYIDGLSELNLAFSNPPGFEDTMELGHLDSHGFWSETVGVYDATPEGLAKFNEEIGEILTTYWISDEELNKLFPPDEGMYTHDDFVVDSYEDSDFAEDYSVGEWDVPPDPEQADQEDEWEAQKNREGFTNTESRAFKKWFHDDTGELTNPDGKPKVFLRGSVGMGATKARDAAQANSGGIFFTTSPRIATEYGKGASVDDGMTIMDAVKGMKNDPSKELKLKYFRGWGPAKDYILRNFQAQGSGLRLIGKDADGNQTDKLSQTVYFSLQTNLNAEGGFRENGDFGGERWRELASFPKNKEGLEQFNLDLGDIIRENKYGVRGYGKFYLSAENTLVIDAGGGGYQSIPDDNLPGFARSPKDTGYSHINGIARRAWNHGYDCVIVKNVGDVGGLQTQYIVKNSSQMKSVYNRGTWDKSRPDFLFDMAETEDHRQRLEDFFKQLEEEYGGGSAEAMFQTFEQLDRARQRAEERAADAEAAQQAAEWAAEAAVEAAQQAERDRADKRLQKQKDTAQAKARQKATEARLSKAKAVQSARLAEQMNAGRQWSARLRRAEENATAKAEAMRQSAQERLDQLRSKHEQEVTDTKLAERMNAGKKIAQEKRKGQEAVEREKNLRLRDHKLAGKGAKEAAAVLRKYQKADTTRLENAPVRTLRDAYHAPTITERIREKAEKLRTLHRNFYKAFINGTQAIDDFSKYQTVDANTSALLRTAVAAGSTVQAIRQDHLVGKDGSTLDDRSLEDVVLCWDGSGKHRKYNDDKQRILQDYMLHRHNIDRMSFREKALAAVEAYEQSYPWLADLEPREFAELVADDNRIAQRYQELIEQFQKAKDKPIFTDENGAPVTAETSRNMVQEYEKQYGWVKEKAEGIYDWWDKFMQEWVVGDSLSAEEYATLREIYPSYVPTYRKDKPGMGKGASAFAGTVTSKKAVRAATGGTSAVANIEDSFMMLLEKNVTGQRTNMVLRSITDTAMLDDTGEFNGFAIFDWDEAPETLRWGLAAEGYEGALEAGTDKAAEKALSAEGNDVYRVRAWANGARVSAFVSKDLYEALEFAFNQKTSWFTKLGQKLTSPMKTFITGINPAFAMRNAIRDNLTAQMNSISVVNSISGIQFEKYYAKAWDEMLRRSENWQHFVALGGTNAGYYNNEGGTYITNLRRQKMSELNPINKAGKALSFVGEHTEQVTRFAEYLATIDRLPGGDTYGNRLVGIKNAAEVTVDFSRKGTWGKAINAWIPYWNPAVQGIDKMVRSFFDQPSIAGKAKVLTRAALTTLPLDVILFAVYHALDRDDEWEKLDDRTKDTYYCIPLPDEHKFLKIPKSRDWGQIIGTPVMRMLQGLDGRSDPFENYFEVSVAPNFLWSNPLDAIILSSAYDLAKNEDFAGRSIVPYTYQKSDKGDQWNDETSKPAKAVAGIVNWISQKFVDEDVLSPMQLDYIIKDYFGDFGSMFQRVTAIGGASEDASAEDRAKETVDDLFGNWVADNRYSNATVSDYYKMLDDVEAEVQDAKNHADGDYTDTPMYKLKNALNAKNGPSKQISDLNAMVREMPDGPEKDSLKDQIAELAQEALQMYDAVKSGEVTEPKMEMEYSVYGDKVRDELISLTDYSEDYAFLPSNYSPRSYTDPKNKKREYVLDDAAKEKYREMYDEEYASVIEEAMRSAKYRNATSEKKAELLEAARDDVAPQVKKEFLKWLAKNYKSTQKK